MTGFMIGFSVPFYVAYFLIIILSGVVVKFNYHKRQLIKANFWLNVAIFALVALLTLVMLNEILL